MLLPSDWKPKSNFDDDGTKASQQLPCSLPIFRKCTENVRKWL